MEVKKKTYEHPEWLKKYLAERDRLIELEEKIKNEKSARVWSTKKSLQVFAASIS